MTSQTIFFQEVYQQTIILQVQHIDCIGRRSVAYLYSLVCILHGPNPQTNKNNKQIFI